MSCLKYWPLNSTNQKVGALFSHGHWAPECKHVCTEQDSHAKLELWSHERSAIANSAFFPKANTGGLQGGRPLVVWIGGLQADHSWWFGLVVGELNQCLQGPGVNGKLALNRRIVCLEEARTGTIILPHCPKGNHGEGWALVIPGAKVIQFYCRKDNSYLNPKMLLPSSPRAHNGKDSLQH